MGKYGKVTYKDNNPKKVKSIDDLAPLIRFVKSNSEYISLTYNWQNHWIPLFQKPYYNSNMEMVLELEIVR